MSANDKQVAGFHYKPNNGGVQHWDYCVGVNVPYLEAAASKYLTRWRKKNGLQDVQKALHYMEKRLESYDKGVGVLKGARKNTMMFEKFITDNGISREEERVLDRVMHWQHRGILVEAIVRIEAIIRQLENEEAEATTAYVNQGAE